MQEADKVRTVFDATIIGVNDNIRSPRRPPPPHFTICCGRAPGVVQVGCARRIKIRRNNWKYMIATIKNLFWANMVGTYGVASARYYWSRVAAFGVLVGHGLRGRLHAPSAQAGGPENGGHLPPVSFFGGISWHKNALGPQNLWLGYRVDVNKGGLVAR